MNLTDDQKKLLIHTILITLLLVVPKLLGLLGINQSPSITIRYFLSHSLFEPIFLPFAFIGSFLIYIHFYPNLPNRLAVVWIVLVAGCLYIPFSDGQDLLIKIIAYASLMGIAACVLSIIWMLNSHNSEILVNAQQLLIVITIPVFIILAYYLMPLTVNLHLTSYDNILYLFDDTLGPQISFSIGRLFEKLPILGIICKVIYLSLPLGITYIFIMHQRQRHPSSVNILFLFISLGLVGFFLYNLVPAAGPIFRFGKAFPYAPPQASLIPIIPMSLETGPRNAMPSLHVAWALAMWWNSYNLGKLARLIIASFLSLTLLAVLGTGQHYFVDIVVAFPFALTLQAIFTKSATNLKDLRGISIIFGGSMTVMWLYVLHYYYIPYFKAHTAISWILVVVTIITSEVLAQYIVRSAFATNAYNGSKETIFLNTSTECQLK